MAAAAADDGATVHEHCNDEDVGDEVGPCEAIPLLHQFARALNGSKKAESACPGLMHGYLYLPDCSAMSGSMSSGSSECWSSRVAGLKDMS